jgi:hypothetical protein
LPCSVFFPPFIQEAILDNAHFCMDINNLKLVTRGWEYFDDSGPILLVKAMIGFEEICDDLPSSGGSDSESQLTPAALSRLATIPCSEFCTVNLDAG